MNNENEKYSYIYVVKCKATRENLIRDLSASSFGAFDTFFLSSFTTFILFIVITHWTESRLSFGIDHHNFLERSLSLMCAVNFSFVSDSANESAGERTRYL